MLCHALYKMYMDDLLPQIDRYAYVVFVLYIWTRDSMYGNCECNGVIIEVLCDTNRNKIYRRRRKSISRKLK